MIGTYSVLTDLLGKARIVGNVLAEDGLIALLLELLERDGASNAIVEAVLLCLNHAAQGVYAGALLDCDGMEMGLRSECWRQCVCLALIAHGE